MSVITMQRLVHIWKRKTAVLREKRAFSTIGRQQNKTSRTGKRAIQLAGSAVEGSLDLDLAFLFLSSFPAMAAWSLSR